MNNPISFCIRFSLALTILVLCIVLLKRLLRKKLTPGIHYYMWLALFLSVPFCLLPGNSLRFLPSLPHLLFCATKADSAGLPAENDASMIMMPDFAVNAPSSSLHISFALFCIWLTGALLMFLRLLFCLYHMTRKYRAGLLPSDPAALQCIRQCEQLLHLRRPLQIRFCSDIQSPVTTGIFRPRILLPATCGNDLKYLLLHEAIHCRNLDTLYNLLMQLFWALNWFNPCVWLAVRKIQCDREIFCDSCVLKLLPSKEQHDYGHVLLDWAVENQFPAIGIGNGKKQLYARIKNIACRQPVTAADRRLGCMILIGVFLLSFFLTPSVQGFTARAETAATVPSHMKEENMDRLFHGFEGSFVLYDQSKDQYLVSDKKESLKRYAPNSTYKIYSGILALEQGRITADDSFRPWNKATYPFAPWNKDQNLSSALKNSVNWYFQELDHEAGKNELQQFYHKIGYGNADLSGSLSSYWMESSLKISAMEQVRLLTDVYTRQLGLTDSTTSQIKNALCLSRQKGSVLYGKTGTGMQSGHEISGWFIGAVEKGADLYVFALHIKGDAHASGSAAAEIAQNILKEKQIL